MDISLSKYVYRRNKKNSVFNENDGLSYCFKLIIDTKPLRFVIANPKIEV